MLAGVSVGIGTGEVIEKTKSKRCKYNNKISCHSLMNPPYPITISSMLGYPVSPASLKLGGEGKQSRHSLTYTNIT